jgi:hypothetical protein
MSNANTIYQEILSSPYFSGSVSSTVKNSHISVIDRLLNYPTGSTTINLWDKLDFFYYFVGDNVSLKLINWKDPNQPTASFKNNSNVYSPSYNYSLSSYGQEEIANWWEGKTTKTGNRFSAISSKDRIAAWTASGAPIENSFVTLASTVQFYTASLVNQGVTFFRSGSTLINSTPYSFTQYPDSGSFKYQYKLAQYKLSSVYNGTGSFNFEGNNNNVLFQNINGIYLGERSIYQPSITSSQTGTNTAVTHSITFNKATGRAAGSDLPSIYSGSVYVIQVYDTSNLNKTFPFNATYNAGFRSKYFYYFQAMQNWIINNSNISSGSNAFLPGLTVYPQYSQMLTLYNGTYLDTNLNLKNKENTNFSNNDSFIGYLKYSPYGGYEFDNITQGYSGFVFNGLGHTYAGAADSETSNNSILLKTNNQYYTSSNGDTGFQVGLGRSISSSYKEKDYVWTAFTSSNPFPYSFFDPGNIDVDTVSYTGSNSSFIAGRPGMYIGQRFTSGNTSTIRQYFNNVNIRETTLSSSIGNIPDGNLFLNGVGTTTYVNNDYVAASTESILNTTLATITSVTTSFDYNKINYTSSGVINSVILNNANINTFYQGYLMTFPSSINDGQLYTIVYSEDYQRSTLPNVGDTLHLGYTNNAIGNIQEISSSYDGGGSDSDPVYYTSITFNSLVTTGSIFNSNSVLRTYFPSYIDTPTIYNGQSFLLEVTGSGLYTTSSVNTDKVFILNPTKTLSNYYSTTNNNQPNTVFNIVSGSDFSFVLSGSTPPFDDLEVNYYLAISGGNEIYSGSELGTTYITDVTASYNRTANNINSETVFYTSPSNDITYNMAYLLQNGTATLPTSSIQGNSFNYRYSGSTTNAQLTLLSPNYLIKYQRPNPELSSSYFTPFGQDLKSYTNINSTDNYACYLGGGGVGNTDLSKLYNIIITDLKVNADYKLTGLNILGNYNQTSYSEGTILNVGGRYGKTPSTNISLLMPLN